MRVLFDGVVETDYGELDLDWATPGWFHGDFDRSFAGQVNGLVGAADTDGVYLNLARRSGGSAVRIELHDALPSDEPSYQDVVEVSITLPPEADLRWVAWAGMDGGHLPGVPAGAYRLRVSARDRDAGADNEFADEVVDAYLLQLWPAPSAPDAIVRVGSADAEYWHREVGGRR